MYKLSNLKCFLLFSFRLNKSRMRSYLLHMLTMCAAMLHCCNPCVALHYSKEDPTPENILKIMVSIGFQNTDDQTNCIEVITDNTSMLTAISKSLHYGSYSPTVSYILMSGSDQIFAGNTCTGTIVILQRKNVINCMENSAVFSKTLLLFVYDNIDLYTKQVVFSEFLAHQTNSIVLCYLNESSDTICVFSSKTQQNYQLQSSDYDVVLKGTRSSLSVESYSATLKPRSVLRVSTFNYPPFVIFRNESDTIKYDGIEYRICNELVSKLKLGMEITEPQDNQMWGELLDNGTYTGLNGDILYGRADIAFAALYMSYDQWQVLEFSFPYVSLSLSFLIPRPQLVPQWMCIILPFQPTLWLAHIVSIVFSVTFLFILGGAWNKMFPLRKLTPYDQIRKTILDIGQIISQGSIAVYPAQEPIRHFVYWWTLFCLILGTAYSASLFSFLTVPQYQKPIETVHELATSALQWISMVPLKVLNIDFTGSEDKDMRLLAKSFYLTDDVDHIKKLLKSRSFAIWCDLLNEVYITGYDFLEMVDLNNLQIMKEKVAAFPIAIAIRKNFPYKDQLDVLIQMLLQSGILAFWQQDIISHFNAAQVIVKVDQSDEEPTSLSLEHFQGAFLLFAFGIVVSSIVHISEYIKHIVEKDKKG